MKRIILFALFVVLLPCVTCWAQPPVFVIETPAGWLDRPEDAGGNVAKRVTPPDGMASVSVHPSRVQGEALDVRTFADLFEDASMNGTDWQELSRVYETAGQTVGGVPMLAREYIGRVQDVAMRMHCVFCEHGGHLFVVAGMYPVQLEQQYGQATRDCVGSFGFSD